MKRLIVAALMCSVTSAGMAAQQSASKGAKAAASELKAGPGEVSLVGCLERESDFRKTAKAGSGGPLGTGLGSSDEYVLADARSISPTADTLKVNGPAAPASYMLGGNLEKSMYDAVNRMVEVVGTVDVSKEAHAVGDKKSDDLPKLKIKIWHTVADFCPNAKK